MRFLFVLSVAVCMVPHFAHAIIPPDVIVSVGAQLAQLVSTIAFICGGLAMVVVAGLRPYVLWLTQHQTVVLFGILATTSISIIAAQFWLGHIERTGYQAQVAELKETVAVQERLLTDGEVSSSSSAGVMAGETQQFFSDALFIIGTGTNQLYLELDLNRRQNENGSFFHYYYVHGYVNGVDVADVVTFTSRSSELVSGGWLSRIELVRADDASTRRTYSGSLTFAGEKIVFTTTELEGDFITKDSLHYTRFQSVGSAQLQVNGENLSSAVLSSTIYAQDFEQEIFFPGFDELESLTHKFILVDEQNNLFVIDESEVFSDTPAYPSHTWVLYKSGSGNLMKKSFTADIQARSAGGGEAGWEITLPDLGATLTVETVNSIDRNDLQIRERQLLVGQVADEQGGRDVRGILHFIER